MTNNKEILLGMFHDITNKYNILDWRMEIAPLLKYNGITYFNRKLIKISSYVIKYNPLEFTQTTLRHECGHMIAYLRHGCVDHGPDWKKVCAEIGGQPERGLISEHPIDGTMVDTQLPQRWAGECCGRQYTYHWKKPKPCEVCGRNINWNRIRKMVGVG